MKIFERVCAFLSMLFAGISAGVLIFSTKYTFFVGDDFVFGKVGYTESGIIVSFADALKMAFEKWFTWSGDVSTMFFQYLFAPICHGGLTRLHLVLALEMSFLFLAIGFFLYVFIQRQAKGWWIWIIMGGIFCVFLNGRSYSQVFHYFVSSSYELSLGFLCVALAFFMLFHTKRKFVFFILTCIFALLAMTGTLLEAGAGCMFVLILIIEYHKEKSLTRYELMLFLVFLFGAIMSAFAPGNFVRHGAINSDISVIMALIYTVRAYVVQLEWLLKETLYVLLFLVSLLCGFIHGRKRGTEKINWFMLLLGLLVPISAIFPYVYGTGNPYLLERVLLNIHFFMIVGLTLFAISCGNALSKVIDINVQGMVATTCTITFVIICVMPCRIEDAATYIVAKSLGNGEIQRYYNEVNELLEEIANNVNEDVVINTLPRSAEGMLEFDLSDDPNYYANVEIANHYRKKSLRLKSIH